jgi:outer membrane protein TolC
MRKTILKSLLISSILISNSAFALQPEIIPLDENLKPIETASQAFSVDNFRLEDALNVAIKQNRSIKNSFHEYQKSEGQVKQARSISGTQITGNFNQTRLDDIGKTTFGGQTFEMGKKDVQKTWLELSQPIFLGSKDKAAIKSARLGREIAQSAHTLTSQQVILETTLQYLNWLLAMEVERVGEKDLELAQAHYDLMEKRFKNELTSNYELLRAEVRLVQTKSLLLQRKNNSKLARLQLLKTLSLPQDLDLKTDSRLEMKELKTSLASDSTQALNLREDLKIKNLQHQISQQSLRSARGEKQPTVALFGQFGTENPSSKSSMGNYERKNYWNAGVAVNFKVLDAGNTKGKIMEAKAAVEQAKNLLKNSQEQTQLEIKNALLTLNTAKEIVISQKENLKQAEEAMRLAKVRFENGIFTQVEMFDAENAYLNANLNYLQSVFSHHRARVSYLLATGKLGREFLLKY